jgi:hypothetical protein
VPETPLTKTPGGLEPEGDGWYVVNVRDACWWRNDVHCPPGTDHVFVGAGDGPCAIVMVGAQSKQEELIFPASELALRHGAGVPEGTRDPRVAYAPYPRSERARPRRRGLPWEEES